jgi:hypothetical protein
MERISGVDAAVMRVAPFALARVDAVSITLLAAERRSVEPSGPDTFATRSRGGDC